MSGDMRHPAASWQAGFAPEEFTVIAGPCAVESREQLLAVAHLLKESGLTYLRGGAYKPRTSPYSFQGLGEEGLALLRETGDEFDLRLVTEVTDTAHVARVAQAADIIQTGTRNMGNFALLEAVGCSAAAANKPVLFKRGMAATLEEWLLAAEYLTNVGARVLYCERGIRTFEKATRFTLDIMAVPLVQQLRAAPVIVDISHSTGRADLAIPAARAALAAGAAGIMVEVHPDPARARCDGAQSLAPAQFKELMDALRPLAAALDKVIV